MAKPRRGYQRSQLCRSASAAPPGSPSPQAAGSTRRLCHDPSRTGPAVIPRALRSRGARSREAQPRDPGPGAHPTSLSGYGRALRMAMPVYRDPRRDSGISYGVPGILQESRMVSPEFSVHLWSCGPFRAGCVRKLTVRVVPDYTSNCARRTLVNGGRGFS